MQSYVVYLFTKKIKLQTNSCHKECTPGASKLHESYVKTLKQQLRIYGCDPFPGVVNARDITTGEELPKDIIENLLNADSIGNKNISILSQEDWRKEQRGFLKQLLN